MSTILVPIDFSDNSNVAIKYAILIAKQLKHKIQLLHIIDLPNFERFLEVDIVRNISREKLEQRFIQYIETKILFDIADVEKLDIEYIIKDGNVTNEIIETSNKLKPVMIIIGQKGIGANKWESFWVGGTTQRVIKKVAQPILVVPETAAFIPIQHIAFATDFNIDDFEVIHFLIEFANHFSANLTVIHVLEPKEKINTTAIDNIKNQFSDSITGGKLKIEVIESQKVSGGLNIYAKKNSVSIMAVLREQPDFLDTVINNSDSIKISMNADIPTLIFKEQ